MATATGVTSRTEPLATTALGPVPLGARRSFNPFRVTGTELPPNLLLAAKLIVVSFFVRDQWSALPNPFLPFIPVFEYFESGHAFRYALQALFLVASAALLVNRYVRAACLVLGSVIFAALLSSRLYFENNRMYVACILLLIGLYSPRQRRPLVCYQVALVYFGAALNKMLDPDWQSGQFVQNWSVNVLHYSFYDKLSAAFPPLMLSLLLAWGVIVVEYALAAGFLFRRLFPLAIALGVAYHTGLLLFTGRTFGMFYFALLSSYLAFVEWPRSQVLVRHPDGDTLRRLLWSALQALDFDRVFRWLRVKDSVHDSGGVEGPRPESLQTMRDGHTHVGVAAYVRILAYIPATYLVLLLLVHSLRQLAAIYRLLLRSLA